MSESEQRVEPGSNTPPEVPALPSPEVEPKQERKFGLKTVLFTAVCTLFLGLFIGWLWSSDAGVPSKEVVGKIATDQKLAVDSAVRVALEKERATTKPLLVSSHDEGLAEGRKYCSKVEAETSSVKEEMKTFSSQISILKKQVAALKKSQTSTPNPEEKDKTSLVSQQPTIVTPLSTVSTPAIAVIIPPPIAIPTTATQNTGTCRFKVDGKVLDTLSVLTDRVGGAKEKCDEWNRKKFQEYATKGIKLTPGT